MLGAAVLRGLSAAVGPNFSSAAHAALISSIAPELRKRMQGKTCFNFRSDPGPEALAELRRLTEACVTQWEEKKWL